MTGTREGGRGAPAGGDINGGGPIILVMAARRVCLVRRQIVGRPGLQRVGPPRLPPAPVNEDEQRA